MKALCHFIISKLKECHVVSERKSWISLRYDQLLSGLASNCASALPFLPSLPSLPSHPSFSFHPPSLNFSYYYYI